MNDLMIEQRARAEARRIRFLSEDMAIEHVRELLRDERRRVWEEAIEHLDAWVLSAEDEEYDNTIPRQEGDGTSHNKALGYLRRVYVGLLNKCRQQEEEA